MVKYIIVLLAAFALASCTGNGVTTNKKIEPEVEAPTEASEDAPSKNEA